MFGVLIALQVTSLSTGGVGLEMGIGWYLQGADFEKLLVRTTLSSERRGKHTMGLVKLNDALTATASGTCPSDICQICAAKHKKMHCGSEFENLANVNTGEMPQLCCLLEALANCRINRRTRRTVPQRLLGIPSKVRWPTFSSHNSQMPCQTPVLVHAQTMVVCAESCSNPYNSLRTRE
jgi:hypothetical protein